MSERQQSEYDEDKIGLIKRTIARGSSDDELALFLEQCRRTGLDPFARQIYAIRRKQWNSQTRSYDEAQVVQVSIDGFRLVADRTRKYAGQVGPWWCGPDGQWQEVWLDEIPPSAARVGVLRHDFQQPLYGIALYKAYVQTNSNGDPASRWKTDPAGMLAKCAESLALRRAFPNELSGLYTGEEMSNVGEVAPQIEASPQLEAGQTAVLPEPAAALPEPETALDLTAALDMVTPSKKKTRLGNLSRDDLVTLVASIQGKRESDGGVSAAWGAVEQAARLIIESQQELGAENETVSAEGDSGA